MAQEQELAAPCKWLSSGQKPTPESVSAPKNLFVRNSDNLSISVSTSKRSFVDNIKNTPQVVELHDFQDTDINTSNNYLVQSPDSSDVMEEEVISTPPLVTEENLHFSLRNVMNKMERMDDKAMAVAKKLNLEGNSPSSNSFDTLSNPELILNVIKLGV